MFWCKTISGNDFTPHRVSGCVWKIEFSKKQFQFTVCFVALTWKIFYTFIFTTNDFQTQTQRGPTAPSSSDHHPKPRRAVELAPTRSSHEITLGRSSRRDRTMRLSCRPLDRTPFVSISTPPEAYRC